MRDRMNTFILNLLSNFTNARLIDFNNEALLLVADGEVHICGKTITIRILLDRFFPLHEPTFCLVPPDVLGYIPHIGANGQICYISTEGVCFDKDNPEGIVKESYSMAIATLEDGIAGTNADDSMNEVVAYFRHHNGMEEYDSNIKLTDEVKPIKLCGLKALNISFLGDHVDKIIEYCNKYYDPEVLENAVYSDAIYIPLQKNTVLPFQWFNVFWDIDQVREIIYKNINARNKRYFDKLLKTKVSSKNPILVVLKLQLPNNNKVLLGLSFKCVDEKVKKDFVYHPLLKQEGEYTLSPIVIKRHDSEYLAPRGGANNRLRRRKVALVGCGSVGGFIAFELARAGIEFISLFDNEVLEETNIYRHTLGIKNKFSFSKDLEGAWQIKKVAKAIALKRNIEDNLPYTEVDVKNNYINYIEKIIQKNEVNYKNYDLIIVAIGNPTIELYLNNYFHSEKGFPPVLFTWLEAYGIGGHAILTNNRGNSGCLTCLYTDPFDKESELYNKASFAEKGQTFSKDMAGCANMFTPYGSLDAVQTAVLATRLAIDVLAGKEIDNPAFSWKGNSESFISAGYKLSRRFSLSSESIYENRYRYKIENCPICNNKGANRDE